MRKHVFGAALAVLALAGTAQASSIKLNYQSSGLFGPGNLQQTVKIHTAAPGFTGKVKAGLFHMTGDQGLGNIWAFCVDLTQFVGNGQKVVEDPFLFSAGIRDNMGRLFSSALGGAGLTSVIDTALEAAGFQVALWEVLMDSGSDYDLTKGAFRMSKNAAVQARAQSYLDAMAGAPGDLYKLTFYKSRDHQDLVTATPMSPVPLPASGVLSALGLAALAGLRRRRRLRTV